MPMMLLLREHDHEQESKICAMNFKFRPRVPMSGINESLEKEIVNFEWHIGIMITRVRGFYQTLLK